MKLHFILLLLLYKYLATFLFVCLFQQQSPSCSSSPTPPTSPSPATVLTPTLPHFIWKKDADLPFATFGARCVFLDDKLYIGGGDCKDMSSDKVVYEYDINGAVRKWTALPSAPVAYFSMGKVNGMLVLVGGLDANRKIATNQLTNWDRETQRWVTKFPPMMTARQDCTVTNHKDWLLVAGGLNFKKPIYNVELLDINNMAWHTTHPLPKPSVGMTSCIVGNTWYLVGGTNFTEPIKGESGPKEYTFSLKLDENIVTNKWEALADTPLYCSAAVPFGEHLMVIGGTDSPTSRTYNASIYLYSTVDEKWMYVGNMPTARSHTACVVIDQGTLVVMGGQERGAPKGGKMVEILYC